MQTENTGLENFDFASAKRAATKPRYTVELTTEGWQIKDNEQGVLLAEVFGGKELARHAASHLNIDAAEGQGRR